MVFYGSRATKIGESKIGGTVCQFCNNTTTQHVSMFGKYAHVYWIPFFPIGKAVVSECTSCKRTIERNDFTDKLESEVALRKDQFKTPIWNWTGLGIIGAIVFFFWFNQAPPDTDPRRQLLESDLSLATTTPAAFGDSTSLTLQSFLSAILAEDLRVDDIRYLTKETESKKLVLLEIPEINYIHEDSRASLLTIVKSFTQDSLQLKEHYVGIFSENSAVVIDSPTVSQNRSRASQKPLYEFYGTKEDFPQTE